MQLTNSQEINQSLFWEALLQLNALCGVEAVPNYQTQVPDGNFERKQLKAALSTVQFKYLERFLS